MTRPQQTEGLLDLLDAAGVEHVIVGGVAAMLHGAATPTRDLDIVIPRTEAALQRLLDALRPHHPRHVTRPDLGEVWQAASELVQHRLILLDTDLGRLDILFVVEPVGAHDQLETIEAPVGRGIHRILSLDQLIEIKAHVGRPKDRIVEQELRAIRALADEP